MEDFDEDDASGQRFQIKLSLVTECSERMSAKDVRDWLIEMFEGCDVGSVSVVEVEEEK